MVVVVGLVIRTVVVTDDVDAVVISVVVVVVVAAGSRAILIGIAIATAIPAPSSPIKTPFNRSPTVM